MLCSTFFSFNLEIGQVQPTTAFQNNIGIDKDKYHSSVTQVECRRLQFLFLCLVIFRFLCYVISYFLIINCCKNYFIIIIVILKNFFSKRNNLSFACSGMFQDDLECFIDAHSTDRNRQTEKRQVRHVSSTTCFQTSGYCLARSNLTRSVQFGTAEARLLKRALENFRCLIIYKVSMELLHLTLAEV